MQRDVIRPWPIQPEHRVPFVPAIKVQGGTLLFMSGTGPLAPSHRHPHVPEDFVVPEDAGEQARRAFAKIKTVVEAAGGSFKDIVKITRYLADIRDQDKLNEVVHEYFGENLPCSTTIQVAAFVVPTMKVEIEAWAVIPDGRGPAARRAAKRPARPRDGRPRRR